MLTAEELDSEEPHKYQLRTFAIPSVLRSILYRQVGEYKKYGNVILTLIPEWI